MDEIGESGSGSRRTKGRHINGRPAAPEGFTYLYLLTCQECVKIGRATMLRNQLQSMQNGNPHEIHLVRQWEVPEDIAPAVESDIMTMLARRWHRGEWFKADEAAAQEAVVAVMARHGLKPDAAQLATPIRRRGRRVRHPTLPLVQYALTGARPGAVPGPVS